MSINEYITDLKRKKFVDDLDKKKYLLITKEERETRERQKITQILKIISEKIILILLLKPKRKKKQTKSK